jgi:PAS domain S-box-containing protein
MTSMSAVPLKSILCTEELDSRPSRAPNLEKENRALTDLVRAMCDSPHTVLQTLADSILDILGCGSAGVSLLSTHDGGKRFYWPAISGSWKAYIGGGTPRDFGPCGDVLDCNAPLLFKHVERRYTYFQPVTPAVEEALLVPFYAENKAVGTIWAVAHDPDRKFDAEDLRQLLSLGRFASAAYQAVNSADAEKHLVAIVESSDDAIISKNLEGIIKSWNRSAERMFGYTPEEAIGQHISLIIPRDRQDEEATILSKLRRGERVDHFETIRVSKNGTQLAISLTISPVKDSSGRIIGASKVARDVTELRRAEESRKEAELSTQLLIAQDEERRRIARDLHDGVGQLLAGISMNVARAARESRGLNPDMSQCIDDIASLTAQASGEIRTVSYLLHPPLLDEIGLKSALGWYSDGFGERSKIKVAMDVAADFGRLPPDYEASLFRIAQECLTNIHRHSGSPTAFLRLSRSAEGVEMEIRDEGRGIDPKIQSKLNSGSSAGVGFRGMKERARIMGGKLTVQSTGNGTSVLVIVPITTKNDAKSSE